MTSMNIQNGSKCNRPTIGVLPGWAPVGEDRPDRYLISVVRGIQSAARTRNCNLLLAWGTGHGADPYEGIPAWPVVSNQTDFVPVGPWNTDGLIVFAPLLNKTRSLYLQQIISEGHPVLFIATGENGPAIQADNEDGIHQAVAHLVEHGHRKIAFIAGDPQDKGDGEYRLAAFHSAVAKYNLKADPRLIVYGNHDFDEAYIATNKILASGVKFTAVLASDDNSAIGTMQALKDAGLQIPHDVAVIGFDDQPEAVTQIPPLTSIHIPLTEIGQRALGLLADHIEGHGRLESVRLPTWLVLRQSCGCLPSTIVSAADSKSSSISTPIGSPGSVELKNRIIQQLAETMFAALPAGLPGLNKNQNRLLCTSLVKAFSASLENNAPSHFQKTLMEFLHEMELANDDIHRWQEIISVMRRGMKRLPVNWKRPNTNQLAEDLLHQARVAISESVQRQYYRYEYQQSTRNYLLSELNARLSVINNKNKAIELLNQYLPLIGIQHSRIALFEPDGEDDTAWSVIIDTDPDSLAESHRFPSRQFPPPGLYSSDQLLSLAILPLVFQNEPLGYVAFDASDLEPCSAIARQLVATFKSFQLHGQVVELSLTDALTGLKNRRYFDLFLKNEVDRSRRFARGLAIIMMDIDHFKEYNDTFGHPAGDEALKYTSKCLIDNRRGADVMVRIGGDEFAIILPETNIHGAQDVANKIRASVANATGLRRQITISLGITELHDSECSAEMLIEQADKALYEAKRTGRDRVCVFEDQK
jgi:diguanylate cyclase (GGDEF)-like protein